MYLAKHNNQTVQRVADVVFDWLSDFDRVPHFNTPEPDVTANERANYILFSCLVEEHISRYYNADYRRVQNAYNFFSWFAESKQQPLQPQVVSKLVRDGKSMYKRMREELNPPNNASLPSDDKIIEVIDDAAIKLTRLFEGDASKMALKWFRLSMSPHAISRNLGRLKGFAGRSESERRVFIKVAMRQGVWPRLKPGAFLHPFSKGVALFILNSGCVKLYSKENTIDSQDQRFQDLIAGTVEKIVDKCMKKLLSKENTNLAKQICEQRFNHFTKPKNLSRWRLSDQVDFLIWDHSKVFCAREPIGIDNEYNECTFARISQGCICRESKGGIWKLENGIFSLCPR